MHALYDLKEMLCKELEEYGKKGDISAGSLDIIDKLAHAAKNVDKLIDSYDGGSYYDGRSYRDRSYARRRDSMGRYSRDYSRSGEIVDQLRSLMHEAPDDMTRQEIQRLVTKMETM